MIRVHDTLQRKKVELRPVEEGHVRMYMCGPTVYDFIHTGNGRPFVVFDVLARHLRARGLKVTYVRNITDIDDKIINRANELGEDPGALADRFTKIFEEDVTNLGCIKPDVEPRVIGTIPEIVQL